MNNFPGNPSPPHHIHHNIYTKLRIILRQETVVTKIIIPFAVIILITILEELIKSTERGILVSHLRYIRMVNPQSLLLTGLTRDGTFDIENGQIKYPIKNFSFNASPVIMLNKVETLGKQERIISVESYRSYLIPAMKIRDFTFMSLSDAV